MVGSFEEAHRRVRAALRRLEGLGLADTHTGVRALVAPELTAWIRENDGDPSRFAP